MSTASRSSNGAAKAADIVWARSAADTAPEPVSSAMKLLRLALALRYRSSAARWPSLPADTRARAKPGRASVGASEAAGSTAAISAIQGSQRSLAVPRKSRPIISERPPGVNAGVVCGAKHVPGGHGFAEEVTTQEQSGQTAAAVGLDPGPHGPGDVLP